MSMIGMIWFLYGGVAAMLDVAEEAGCDAVVAEILSTKKGHSESRLLSMGNRGLVDFFNVN